ncbi:MAG TPA: hypothetical protein VFZ31_12910, partial [Vicinamibacterales bacterium]
MNRRAFVSRVTLGGVAAACTGFRPSEASAAAGQFRMRFVGMMGFIERADRSFLVATPGQLTAHMTHVPFLMARAGTPIAKALGMAPARGVVPAAFDTELVGSNPAEFVYRNLANTSIEIISGTSDAVSNRSTEMAVLNKIAPGKRVRGNIERWASTTISLRGGRLDDSAAHPDAHKVWSFGDYKQRLTDAVNYTNAGAGTTIRLTSGTDVRTYTVAAGETCDLSMISAAQFEHRMNDPMRLVHSEVVFEYLVDAKPVLAECAEATGREVPPSELPYVVPTSASTGIAAGAAFPPYTEFC